LSQKKLPDDPDDEIMLKMFIRVSRQELLDLNKQMDAQGEVFRQTGGVHSAALCTSERIVFRTDDIGRHNAVDKVIGWATLNGVDVDDKLLLTTGRISSDLALKALRVGITIVASRGAPTHRALEYAQRLGLTVIGFARGKRMSVYTWPNRCSDPLRGG
jgi:FdhD protein